MEILESYTEGYRGLDLAPHTDAERLSITPPSTRRYHVTHILLYLYRTGAATAQGQTLAAVHVQRVGEQSRIIAVAELHGTEVGASGLLNLMTDITIYPGDTLRALTIDTSTGGTISYWITINYDAIP